MLKKIKPQKVEDKKAGYIVQVYDKHHIEYIENNKQILVEVEFGENITYIIKNSINEYRISNIHNLISECEKNKIISRIEAGLQLMGCIVEIV